MKTITETEYDQLCSVCDALLKKNSSSPARMSNGWLNVIREHPIFLQLYTSLFKKQSLTIFKLTLVKKMFIYVLISSAKLLLAFYRRHILNEKMIIPSDKVDSIFVTHLLNEGSLNNSQDFYFFNLPHKWKELYKSSALVYINHSSRSVNYYQKAWKNEPIERIVLPKYSSINNEIRIRFQLIKEMIRLLREKVHSNFEKKIKYQAAIESISSASHSNLRFAYQTQAIIKQIRANYLFTTFEGHPWEKLMYSFSRKANPLIQCIGYQHALIFKKQHAIKGNYGANYLPDYVLCSGEDAQKKLIKSNFLSPEKLRLFGTNRVDLTERDLTKIKSEQANVFLFLPEGHLIECLPLIDLAMQLADSYPKLELIFRLHPILSLEKVFKKRPQLKKTRKNLIISKELLEADFSRAKFAIYRGSTTIIKAIQYGLIPIYYGQKNEISIDPLYKFKKIKDDISKAEDIPNILSKSSEIQFENQKELVKQIKTFFSPLNLDEALQLKQKK